MSAREIVWLVLAAACAAAAVFRWVVWRQSQSAVAGSNALLLAALSVAMVVNPAPVGDWVSRAVGWPNGTFLLSQPALIVMAAAGLGIARAASGKPLRGIQAVTACVIIVFVASFFAAGRLEEMSRDLIVDAPLPWIALCGLIVAIWVGYVGIAVLTFTVPNAGISSAEKRGMVVLATGVAVMVVYCVVRGIGLLVLLWGGADRAASVFSGDAIVAVIGAPLVVLGCIYAPVERATAALRHTPAVRRLYSTTIGDPPAVTWHVVRDLDELTAELGDVLAESAAGPAQGEGVRSWVLSRTRTQR